MSEFAATASSGLVPVPPSDGKTPCRICATRIPIDGAKCTTCGSWQKGKPCLVCGIWMPDSAIRCGECSSFRNWRRYLPVNEVILALLVSLFSVLGTAIPVVVRVIRLPSDTTAIVLDSELDKDISTTKRVLIVRAFNAGGSSSIVRGAKLDLTNVSAMPVELSNETPKESEVPASKQADLKFFASVVRPVAGATPNAVAKLLCTRSVTLLLNVEEQTRFGKYVFRPEPLRVTIGGRQVRPWVLDKMTVEEKPCE